MAERSLNKRILEVLGLSSREYGSNEVAKARKIYEQALQNAFQRNRRFKTEIGAEFLRVITQELEGLETTAVKEERRLDGR